MRLFLLMLLFVRQASAQTERFGIFAEVTENGARDYTLKDPDGNKVADSETGNRMEASILANLPVVHGDNWVVSATGRYRYDHIGLDDETVGNGNEDFHLFNVGVSGNYRTKLFHRPAVFMGSIGCEFSQEGYERVNAFAAAIVFTKQTKDERIGFGAVTTFSFVSILPVFPLFIWQKTFNDRWSVDCFAPRSIYFNYKLGKDDKLVFSEEINSTILYNYDANHSIGYDTYFDQKHIDLFVKFEHSFTRHLRFSVQAGGGFAFRGRIYDNDNRYDDPYYKFSQNFSFKANAKFSYAF